MKSIVVELTKDELFDGVRTGIRRNLQNILRGRKHRWSAQDVSAWDSHINGALGELCVAKALNREWTGKPVVLHGAKNDVDGVEVRTTTYAAGKLLIHPDDQDDTPYILVTGYGLSWILRGWILGRDAKQQKWYRDVNNNRRFAYFVPQDSLHGMDTLHRRSSNE